MGMPITIEGVDNNACFSDIDQAFAYFDYVDHTFSTYKPQSEISCINRGELKLEDAGDDMQTIFRLAEQTKQATHGFFDIHHGDSVDPSGIVKGWAIEQVSQLLQRLEWKNFTVEAGGDIAVVGHFSGTTPWKVGVRHPFEIEKIVKVLSISNLGVATSGTYLRGHHIYNPRNGDVVVADIASLTVIGPNIYEADRFATAAFAMGSQGIQFIENLAGFEGYMIDSHGTATLTTGFDHYCLPS